MIASCCRCLIPGSQQKKMHRMFRKGALKVESILDVRSIIQTHKLVVNLTRMLFPSSKDRAMLYMQRRSELLASGDEIEDGMRELSLNRMRYFLKESETNKSKLTGQEVEFLMRLNKGLYADPNQ